MLENSLQLSSLPAKEMFWRLEIETAKRLVLNKSRNFLPQNFPTIWYMNEMASQLHLADNFLAMKAQVHLKLANCSKNLCGYLNLENLQIDKIC